ncbi:MAG: hypothetical protein ACUVT2_02080 [Thiobacillaceae bacterium]
MHRSYVFAALLALMALTRIGHFGTALSLPDASLAIFLLGGLWLGRWIYFPAFMALAFGIDVYLAQTATEAGWCLTPAYWGLLPTYALMWLAGRWLFRAPARMQAERYAAAGILATTLAFVVSNLTFWAFSGYFGEMTLSTYALTVVKYYPPYLGSTLLYLALGWVAHRIVFARRMAVA